VKSAYPPPYRTGSWDPHGLGNHRAVVQVGEPAPAVRVRLPWRRRDPEPERKAVIVRRADTGERVGNASVTAACAAYGDLVFEAAVAGVYHIYYLPQIQEGWQHQPETRYLLPEETAEAAWVERYAAAQPPSKLADLPEASVEALEAVDDFHRFDPMEVAAAPAEVEALLARYPKRGWLVFPEDRCRSVRMGLRLPLHWVDDGPAARFAGSAGRNEYYTFQLALFAARHSLTEVSLEFGDLVGPRGFRVPAADFHCINLGGRDWLGQPISREVSVPMGKVQALWVGVQIPLDAPAGAYSGRVTVRARAGGGPGIGSGAEVASKAGASPGVERAPVPDAGPSGTGAGLAASSYDEVTVELTLEVSDQVVADGGDADLWRQSRLRWLDSTLGVDDECLDPYPPVQVEGSTVRLLGHSVRVGESGLPDSIGTRYTPSVQDTAGPEREMLAGPVGFTAVDAHGEVPVSYGSVSPRAAGSGVAQWHAAGEAADLALEVESQLECDGYLTVAVTVRAAADRPLEDLRLTIPLRAEFARYLMGMGYRGGARNGDWQWQWSDHANHMVWVGDVSGGLQLKLMYDTDVWELYSLASHGPPPSWGNDGAGGCAVTECGDGAVEVCAYCGPRVLRAGEPAVFRFGLLLTPFHPLDRGHWDWRYFGDNTGAVVPADEMARKGARVCHLHQGNDLNPHINYPFVRDEELRSYTAAMHERDLRLILYYTVRELSNYAAEIWALCSLGDEIFRRDDGFRLADHFADEADRAGEGRQPDGLQGKGGSWLWEHLDDFSPAWHHPLGGAHQDAAIATQGLSRLHNYYVEGLNYLVRHTGIDGVYLDGIGYDRQIMKRVRKVLKRARADTLISFHSGNNFDERYGLNSPAVQYLEHLPWCDSVWFGEGYDYGSQPDYWLVEISGIPFGLSGEMLQGGGNLWRGMLYYGMANRLGWGEQSRPEALWRFWDESGIAAMEMLGYWDPRCPVQTNCDQVLATVYVGERGAVIALASWAGEEVTCRLQIGGDAWRGSAQVELRAPAIEGFQDEARFAAGARNEVQVPVAPGRGWLLTVGY